MVLTLHLGPVGGRVRLEVSGKQLDVMMSADETRTVAVDVPRGSSYVSIAVQAPGAFRPADVNPKSSDVRSLGCQVRVAREGAGQRADRTLRRIPEARVPAWCVIRVGLVWKHAAGNADGIVARSGMVFRRPNL